MAGAQQAFRHLREQVGMLVQAFHRQAHSGAACLYLQCGADARRRGCVLHDAGPLRLLVRQAARPGGGRWRGCSRHRRRFPRFGSCMRLQPCVYEVQLCSIVRAWIQRASATCCTQQ
jgi:hypothetical protein